MSRNDDGEFELVLGNRQLVSVFLIVVILMGVFFSMGYIVGRNSSPPSTVADASRGTGKPILVEPPRSSVQQPMEPAPESVKPSPSQSTEPPQASRPEPKREPPKPAQAAEARPTETRPVAPSTDEPTSGQAFLQVVATTRPDAELVAESLGKKGFKTTVASGPNPALYRVLVGPLKDAADLAETRVRLEGAGFKPIVRRY